ncbi:WXG100 family type VII secretion target [Streptomyces sp. URMC 123]|uniref:WXG100 family type VII secretion target n=1 Tax=Streptomyces sp. URMC 123 TaxID=3423403 RepID=UPI003F1967F4
MNFSDVAEPTSRLKAPGVPEEFSSPIELLNAAGDLLSPTAWMIEVLRMSLGINPLEKAQSYFAGDWQAYARCAEVWGNLEALCEDMAANLASGARTLDATWDGSAAESAQTYFDELRRDTLEIKRSLDAMRREYEVAAHGVWSTAKMVGQALQQLADHAALAALSAAAGSALSWTGGGAILGFGVSALQIRRIIDLWDDATRAINALQRTIDGVYGQLANIGAELAASFHRFPLPRAAYDHPLT